MRLFIPILLASSLSAQTPLLLQDHFSSSFQAQLSVAATMRALQAQISQLQLQVFELQVVEMERRFGKTMRQVDNSKVDFHCDFKRQGDKATLNGYAVLLPRSRWVSIAYERQNLGWPRKHQHIVHVPA
jgi:hypothetical protein